MSLKRLRCLEAFDRLEDVSFEDDCPGFYCIEVYVFFLDVWGASQAFFWFCGREGD